MRKARALLALSLIVSTALPALAAAGAAAGTRKHRAKTSSKSHVKPASSSRFQPRQRAIDDARATEIQQALIKAGYMTGSPSGHWDAASIAAMSKLQADNGWQTKLVPDSRAIIKLGLGPSPSAPAPSAQTTASLSTPAASYAR